MSKRNTSPQIKSSSLGKPFQSLEDDYLDDSKEQSLKWEWEFESYKYTFSEFDYWVIVKEKKAKLSVKFEHSLVLFTPLWQ